MALLPALGLALGINWAGWFVSRMLKTEKFYDLCGTSTFVVLAGRALLLAPAITQRKLVAVSFVTVWAVRLGFYLVYRVHKVGKDSRFDKIKDDEAMFFAVWTIQGIWAWVTLLPTLLVVSKPLSTNTLLPSDYLGVAAALCGLLVESVADWQKFSFRQRPENAGKFVNTGLWSCSRYPNYFGEMIVWWGVYILCAADLQHWQLGVGLLSPLFVMFLLTRMSGIPIQEKQGKQRWGDSTEYKKYLESTSLLIPLPYKVRA